VQVKCNIQIALRTFKSIVLRKWNNVDGFVFTDAEAWVQFQQLNLPCLHTQSLSNHSGQIGAGKVFTATRAVYFAIAPLRKGDCCAQWKMALGSGCQYYCNNKVLKSQVTRAAPGIAF
jgi:hypothetical protein